MSAYEWCTQGLEMVAAFLAINPSLRAIGLHYNGFSLQGAAALATALYTNHTLQELALYSNKIGPDGAVVLAKALAVNRGVISVDIGGNAIADAGAMAMASALRRNTTMTDLHLDFNQIGEDGANALAWALTEPRSDADLSSEDCSGVDANANKTLTTLWLHGNTVGTTTQRSIEAALGRNQKLVPRRLAAAYQRLALAAIFTPSFQGQVVKSCGDKLVLLVKTCLNELAVQFNQADDAVATVLVTSRFENEGWAWRMTQELTTDVCAAVLKVAAGRTPEDIRGLLGTVVKALSTELINLANRTELELEDTSSSSTGTQSSLELTTATRRKQREAATQDTENKEGIGPQHKKQKQKQKQQKRACEEQSESVSKSGSSLANLIATTSLAAYQSQCPVRNRSGPCCPLACCWLGLGH